MLAWLFVLSRLAFLAAGMRFDDSPLESFWQYLDPELLRHDLARSLFYLHAQPPAYNAWVGLVLKLFPGLERGAFAAAFAILGLAAHLATYGLMRGAGVSRGVSWALVAAAILAPSSVIYENFLFYDLPVMALLALAALALQRAAAAGGRGRAGVAALVAFAGLIAATCWTRSLFHLVYPAGLAVLRPFLAAAPLRRRLAAALAAASAVVLVLFIKNLVVFGSFSSSTWLGMTVAKMTRHGLSDAELRSLHEAGVISEVSLITQFRPVEKYPSRYWSGEAVARFTHVPALVEPWRAGGQVNYNHVAYVEISRQYRTDALAMARRHPGAWASAFVRACYHFGRPASVERHLEAVRAPIAGFERWWNALALARVPLPLSVYGDRPELHLVLLAGLVAGVGFAAWTLVVPSRARAVPPERRVALGFMLLTAAYVFVVGNVLIFGENFRHRLYVAPYLLVFAGMAVDAALGAIRARRAGAPRG